MGVCSYLGNRLKTDAGEERLSLCQTCPQSQGRLLPVYACHHQAHGPEAVRETKCRVCPGFVERKEG